LFLLDRIKILERIILNKLLSKSKNGLHYTTELFVAI